MATVRSRGWVGTWNDDAAGLLSGMVHIRDCGADRIVVQEEQGEGGRVHLQLWVWWKNARTHNSALSALGNSTHCSIDKQQGSNIQAWNYCRKCCKQHYTQHRDEDHDFNTHGRPHGDGWTGGARFESGEQPGDKGKRTTLANAVHLARTHGVKRAAAEEGEAFARYHKGLEKHAALGAEDRIPRHRDVTVWWLWGDAGSGKSHFAETFDEDNNTCVISDSKEGWFDGYNGEGTLVLDEFEGLMPYVLLKRVLDKYRLQVPVKGGFVAAAWTRVIITSNMAPWQMGYTDQWDPGFPARVTPLSRRVNGVFHGVGQHPNTVWTPPLPAPRPPQAPAPAPAPAPPQEEEEEEEGGDITLTDTQLLSDAVFEDFLNPADADYFRTSSADDILADLEGLGDPEPRGRTL